MTDISARLMAISSELARLATALGSRQCEDPHEVALLDRIIERQNELIHEQEALVRYRAIRHDRGVGGQSCH